MIFKLTSKKFAIFFMVAIATSSFSFTDDFLEPIEQESSDESLVTQLTATQKAKQKSDKKRRKGKKKGEKNRRKSAQKAEKNHRKIENKTEKKRRKSAQKGW